MWCWPAGTASSRSSPTSWPRRRSTALQDQQKVPLIYTNVLIRNWSAFAKLGIEGFEAPGHFW